MKSQPYHAWFTQVKKVTTATLSILAIGSPVMFLTGCQDESATTTTSITEGINTEIVSYSVSHTFSINDITGQFDGRTYAQNPSILCGIDTNSPPCEDTQPLLVKKSGETLFPVDSEFGYDIEDFVGAAPKELDSDYAEGWANNINLAPNGAGLMVANAATDVFKAPKLTGSWCSG